MEAGRARCGMARRAKRGVKQECQKDHGYEQIGQMLFAMPEVVFEVIALGFECVVVLVASRPEELHLRPLTERCVNLSIHTAPIKQTNLPSLSANVQRDTAVSSTVPQETCLPVSNGLSAACTSSSPKPPTSC